MAQQIFEGGGGLEPTQDPRVGVTDRTFVLSLESYILYTLKSSTPHHVRMEWYVPIP